MGYTAADIARRVEGVLEGDGMLPIRGVAGLAEARPGDLSFLANPRYAALVAATRASAVLVRADWQGASPAALIRVANPDRAFAAAVAILAPPPVAFAPGIHPSAVVAEGVALGAGVHVGPHAVLEPGVSVGDRTVIGAGCYIGHGTRIGSDCRLYPRVSVRERTSIGSRVIVHNGAVIGSDGFGYARLPDGRWEKIPQVGVVEIGDDVEIGANATIDRARFGRTVIGQGVKIDNLVQIAHNVTVGDHSALAAQVGIAGSTHVGRRVQMGGQAGVVGHVTVGDDVVVGGQAGVLKDVPAKTFVSGYPAMPHNRARRAHAALMRLDVLRQRVAALERRLGLAAGADGGGEDAAPGGGE